MMTHRMQNASDLVILHNWFLEIRELSRKTNRTDPSRNLVSRERKGLSKEGFGRERPTRFSKGVSFFFLLLCS